MKKIEGLPVIDVDESEEVTVAVRADDLLEGDTGHPERHPIALALRRQDDVDEARVTKNDTLVRRGKKWFRYDRFVPVGGVLSAPPAGPESTKVLCSRRLKPWAEGLTPTCPRFTVPPGSFLTAVWTLPPRASVGHKLYTAAWPRIP